jgi:hypothetical protein
MAVASFRENPTLSLGLRIALWVGFVALFGSLVVGALIIARGMVFVFAGDPQQRTPPAGCSNRRTP